MAETTLSNHGFIINPTHLSVMLGVNFAREMENKTIQKVRESFTESTPATVRERLDHYEATFNREVGFDILLEASMTWVTKVNMKMEDVGATPRDNAAFLKAADAVIEAEAKSLVGVIESQIEADAERGTPEGDANHAEALAIVEHILAAFRNK